MADQKMDETKPIASGIQPGPTEHLAGNAPQATLTTGSDSATTTSTGSRKAAGVKSSASTLTAKASDTVKQSTSRIAEEAKQYAGDMAGIAKEKSRTLFDQQKETAVGKVDSIVSAIRSTAENMQRDGQQEQIGRYITMAADRLESFGTQLRQKNLDNLIEDTQNLARRSPGVFFAGTVFAGFLLSRFLKSSAERRDEYEDDQYATASMPAAGTYTTQTDFDSSTDIASAYRTNSTSAAGTGSTLGTATGTAGTGTLATPLKESDLGGDIYGNR